MAENRDVFIKIAEGLKKVRDLYKGIALIKIAYSYTGWLIPLSITLILQNIAPLAERHALLQAIIIIIWVVSIPVIFIVLGRVFRRLGIYAYTLGITRDEKIRSSRTLIIAWVLAWIIANLLYPALRVCGGIRLSPDTQGALTVVTALTIGVSSLAIWEYHYYRAKISFVPALILASTILLVLVVPAVSPWNIAYGGIFLSYTIAITLYIHEGLKIIAEHNKHSEG